MSKKYINLIIAASFTLLFAIWTILVMKVDVASIGPMGSNVGLSHLNNWFFSFTSFNDTAYKISEIVGYISFAIIAFYAGFALYQWIKGKSFFKIDYRLIVLGVYFVIIGIIYFACTKIEINFRPVMINDKLEPSYPSSHTILAFSLTLSSCYFASLLFTNKKVKVAIYIVSIVIGTIVFITRLVSGAHWLSDIIGAIFLALALYFYLVFTIEAFEDKKAKIQ